MAQARAAAFKSRLRLDSTMALGDDWMPTRGQLGSWGLFLVVTLVMWAGFTGWLSWPWMPSLLVAIATSWFVWWQVLTLDPPGTPYN